MNCSVLSVGTELTTGQIINKNAAFLSQALKQMGLLTAAHLTVPDERKIILRSLKICAQESDLIFVTGGLGPTTDDFTRDVIAQWAKKKLKWDEKSWKMVQEYLIQRGQTVRDFQKQQCFFPQGSRILFNRRGTAHAFFLKSGRKSVFVLPGPPKEIEALWKNDIAPWIKKNVKVDPVITRIWDTIGFGESEIAVRAEEALKGSKLEIGYRVHMPYVEVKVSYLKSKEKSIKKWLNNLEQVLSDRTVFRDGHEAVACLSEHLKKVSSFRILDNVSRGHLFSRLEPQLKTNFNDRPYQLQNYISPNETETSFHELVLYLKRLDDWTALVGWFYRGQKRELEISSPQRSPHLQERRQQFFAEMAMITWSRQLSEFF